MRIYEAFVEKLHGQQPRKISIFDSAYNAAKAEKWYLEVRESNLWAIQFYEKLGFERVGMRKIFYTAPTENAVLMALQPTENGEINDI